MNENMPNGVLVLHKQSGCTSFDCVAAVRRLYGIKKVGHAGTLDPDAEGVLPILLGSAARAAQFLTEKDKKYQAVLRLGVRTDTQDAGGTVLQRCATVPPAEAVQTAAATMVGEILQTPPMYSALKIGGKKLCDLARQGITVERQPRPVTVYALELSPCGTTEYRMRVHCSKGTYVRTLCADLGDKLGCGGIMVSLCRTQSGPFQLSQSVTLEALSAMTQPQRLSCLLPTEDLFTSLPVLILPAFFERLCRAGLAVALGKLPKLAQEFAMGAQLRLYGADGFFALGQVVLGTNEDPMVPAVKALRQFS